MSDYNEVQHQIAATIEATIDGQHQIRRTPGRGPNPSLPARPSPWCAPLPPDLASSAATTRPPAPPLISALQAGKEKKERERERERESLPEGSGRRRGLMGSEWRRELSGRRALASVASFHERGFVVFNPTPGTLVDTTCKNPRRYT